MRGISALLLLGALLLITGCDTIHGVQRFAPAAYLPSPVEIKETVLGVRGVIAVEVKQEPSRGYLSLGEGFARTPNYCQLLISGEAASTVLAIGRERGKEVAFYTIWMNQLPTEAEVRDATRLMDLVYDALLNRFPLLPAKNVFKETSVGRALRPTLPESRG